MKKVAVDSFLHSNFVPCMALHEKSATLMIFKFVESTPDTVTSSSAELQELLNTEFILPDGTPIAVEFTSYKKKVDDKFELTDPHSKNVTLFVNNKLTNFVDWNTSSYKSQIEDERVFRYDDLASLNISSFKPDVIFSDKHIQLSCLLRFSFPYHDLEENTRETNFIEKNTHLSYTLNLNTLSLNKRYRNPEWFEQQEFYKKFSPELLRTRHELNAPPVFHLYTGDEDVSDYRNCGILINHGPAGFWCNFDVECIDAATARNSDPVFQYIESRINIPQGEADDHSS